MKSRGALLPVPGLMSFTIRVPASLPSVFQSSMPFTPSVALKYTISPTQVNKPGLELPDGLMSFNNTGTCAVADSHATTMGINRVRVLAFMCR